MGGVCAAVAGVDERNHLPAGYCGESRYARGPADDSGILRFQLFGRSVRFVRHADQRQSTHGVLRAGRSTAAADKPICIEPLSKFPVVRDLTVDRQFMFESLKRVKAWIPIDGTYNLGEGPRIAPEVQEKAYPLSRCISCGNCLEVCPQVNEHNNFMGAAIFSQVRLFNMHPTGAMHAKERIQAVMGHGGIEDCANAQNCVKACPKEIPLTESLAEINRQAWKQALFGWLVG